MVGARRRLSVSDLFLIALPPMGVNNMKFPMWTNYLKEIRDTQIPINDNQTVEKNSGPECLVGLPRSGKLLSIRHVGPDSAIKILTVLLNFTFCMLCVPDAFSRAGHTKEICEWIIFSRDLVQENVAKIKGNKKPKSDPVQNL